LLTGKYVIIIITLTDLKTSRRTSKILQEYCMRYEMNKFTLQVNTANISSKEEVFVYYDSLFAL